MTKLTIKQEKFCNKYVECGNASEAYRHAYSCAKMKPEGIAVNSSKLLNRTNVTLRVKELQEELKAKSDITKEQILNELKPLSKSSIANYHTSWTDRKKFEDLTEAERAAIKSIQTRTRRQVIGDDTFEIEEIKIELFDKLKAIDTINNMLGFYEPNKTEVTGKNGKPLIPEPLIIEVIDNRNNVYGKDTDN